MTVGQKQVTNPRVLRTRDMQLYELALEFAYGQPYEKLLAEARRTDACEEVDLLQLGRKIFLDMVRLSRGEISEISIPRRLPRRGEFQL